MKDEARRALELERVRKLCASSAELLGHTLEQLEHAIACESLDDAISHARGAAQPMLTGAMKVLEGV